MLHITEIKEELKEIKSDGKETKTQAKITNGRVTALENWRWFIAGGLAIIAVIILPVLFLLLKEALDK